MNTNKNSQHLKTKAVLRALPRLCKQGRQLGHQQSSLQGLQQNHQQGAVLIVAVVFLLIITILGLSAIKMSGIDSQIAGNSMLSMLTFQGAESTLAKSGKEKYIIQASSGTVFNVPATDLPEERVGAGILKSKAAVALETTFQECPSHMASSNKFKCSIYKIDANSQIKGSSAKSQHTMGWGVMQAKVN